MDDVQFDVSSVESSRSVTNPNRILPLRREREMSFSNLVPLPNRTVSALRIPNAYVIPCCVVDPKYTRGTCASHYRTEHNGIAGGE